MSTFVLLHGAFHGGWCWSRVARLLRTAGHDVFTPTQTGLGERAHLIHADITLGTFVDDVVSVLDVEELEDVVLVGHSFGGHAISGAASRVAWRIRHLVYLDSVFPQDGVAPLDSGSPESAAERRRLAADSGGVSVAPPDPFVFGVSDGADAAWVRRRMTPQPFGALNSAIPLAKPLDHGIAATYVFCTNPVYEPLARARERARGTSWAWRELAAGHDCMITAPEATAALLMEIGA